MSRDQKAGRSHIKNSDNISFEKVQHFKYLGTTLKYQNSTQEEIKSRLKSGNACYIIWCIIFVFQFATQKCKYRDIQHYNLNCCFVWV